MIGRQIAPEDPEWQRSYPSFRDPLPGESLPSFLLDLDERNGFDAGQTCRVIRLHGVGPARFGPGYFLSAACFDLSTLGELAGALPLQSVLPMTARPIVEWLLGDRTGTSNTLAPAPRFRICPSCLAEGLLPILFLFDQVSGCVRHGVHLVEQCSCGEPIVPFVQQEPGQCHVYPCEQRYVELIAQPMSAEQAVILAR